MGIERADMAIRLVEERARLGYSQSDLARQTDISREGLRRYETGQHEIGTGFLARAAGLGFDVQYVLTGVRSKNLDATEKAAAPSVSVSETSTANVVQVAQAGATVNINHHSKVINRTVAKGSQSGEHINEVQVATLTQLVDEVVSLQTEHRKTPGSHRAVWSALNAHCGVTCYRLIPRDGFERAEKYLRKWIGRLNSAPPGPAKENDAWRKRKYAYIQINTNDDLGASWLSSYLQKTFQAGSVEDLSDDDLARAYQAVVDRKRDDNDAWRKRKYAYIQINTKDDQGPLWLANYLKNHYQVDSIEDLSDDDLNRTYQAVASRKRDALRRVRS